MAVCSAWQRQRGPVDGLEERRRTEPTQGDSGMSRRGVAAADLPHCLKMGIKPTQRQEGTRRKTEAKRQTTRKDRQTEMGREMEKHTHTRPVAGAGRV